MSFSDYSLTPANNGTLGGLDVSEGCSPANLNNGIRQLMTDGKELADEIAAFDLDSKANLNAPIFTGQPTYQNRGAFLHHNNSANTSGRIFVQAASASTPSMQNGDWLATF